MRNLLNMEHCDRMLAITTFSGILNNPSNYRDIRLQALCAVVLISMTTPSYRNCTDMVDPIAAQCKDDTKKNAHTDSHRNKGIYLAESK
jgi:hypothetical protein